MKTRILHSALALMAGAVVAVAFAACQQPTATQPSTMKATTSGTGSTAGTTTKPTTPAGGTMANVTPAAALPTIRIKAGTDQPIKDKDGNTWAPDTGFDNSDVIDRPELTVTGTDKPELFHSEHYSMNSWTTKLPNGNYTLNLYFSEDYEGITDPTGRVFTYEIKDGTATAGKSIKIVKDFSPWGKSGAHSKAYVDKTDLTVTNGQLTIVFTPQMENPQINAIEILPRK